MFSRRFRTQGLNPLRASTMVTRARKNSLLIRKKPYAEPQDIRGGPSA